MYSISSFPLTVLSHPDVVSDSTPQSQRQIAVHRFIYQRKEKRMLKIMTSSQAPALASDTQSELVQRVLVPRRAVVQQHARAEAHLRKAGLHVPHVLEHDPLRRPPDVLLV